MTNTYSRRDLRSVRLRFDALESRNLLSAVPSASTNDFLQVLPALSANFVSLANVLENGSEPVTPAVQAIDTFLGLPSLTPLIKAVESQPGPITPSSIVDAIATMPANQSSPRLLALVTPALGDQADAIWSAFYSASNQSSSDSSMNGDSTQVQSWYSTDSSSSGFWMSSNTNVTGVASLDSLLHTLVAGGVAPAPSSTTANEVTLGALDTPEQTTDAEPAAVVSESTTVENRPRIANRLATGVWADDLYEFSAAAVDRLAAGQPFGDQAAAGLDIQTDSNAPTIIDSTPANCLTTIEPASAPAANEASPEHTPATSQRRIDRRSTPAETPQVAAETPHAAARQSTAVSTALLDPPAPAPKKNPEQDQDGWPNLERVDSKLLFAGAVVATSFALNRLDRLRYERKNKSMANSVASGSAGGKNRWSRAFDRCTRLGMLGALRHNAEPRPTYTKGTNSTPSSDHDHASSAFITEREFLAYSQRLDASLKCSERLVVQYTELSITNKQLTQKIARLTELAATDPLTGLKNRRHLHESLNAALRFATRENLPTSLMMIDVDYFKAYNDSFGHAAGDEALCLIARLLQEGSRPFDLVCRYGGEEFVILLPGTNAITARKSAEHARALFTRHVWPRAAITASFGIATAAPGSVETSELLEQADSALYRAKFQGRNRVVHHEDFTSAVYPTQAQPASPMRDHPEPCNLPTEKSMKPTPAMKNAAAHVAFRSTNPADFN